MITLIWKELRENARWAILALLALGSTEVYALYPHDTQEQYYGGMYNGVTLLRPDFLTVTTFGCAGVGLLFGLLQIIPELKRDRWAALLHRPMSRAVIYRGKIVGGLLLYLGVTVPSFLLAVWMTATPGHFSSPFVPAMVQPGVADICTGAVYYFAAIAMTLPRGGWAIARVLPLLAALHVSYFVQDQQRFHVAVEATVLMSLALFTAAWGEILEPHSLAARPWLAKVAMLAVAIYGACGLQDLGHSFLSKLKSAPGPDFEDWEFTRDEGRPLLIVYSSNGIALRVLDLDGKPVSDPKYRPEVVRSHVDSYNSFSGYIGDSHGWQPWRYRPKYRELRDYFYGDNPYSFPRLEQWFNLYKQHYWIGFWPDKKQAFGYLDAGGFEPITATPKPFPQEVQEGYAGQAKFYLWSPNAIRLASLADRRMTNVSLPVPGPIYGSGYGWGSTAHGANSFVGFVTNSGVVIFDTDGKVLTILPYHHDVSKCGYLRIGANGNLDRFFMNYQPSMFLDDKAKHAMPSFMDVVDRQGNVVHSYTMPPLPKRRDGPRSWQGFIEPRTQSPAGYFGLMAYKRVAGTVFHSKRLAGDLSGQFNHDHIHETVELSIYVVCFALLLAAATFLMARRGCFELSSALRWAAIAFTFSLPGFVAFWLCADWPTLVACPTCGRRRPIQNATCPHCGAGWPLPAVNGLEIIDGGHQPATAGQTTH